MAKESRRVLASRVQIAKPLRLGLIDNPTKETVAISASVVRMLIQILEEHTAAMT